MQCYYTPDRLVMVGYVQIGGPTFSVSSNASGPLPSLSGDIQPFFDWQERKDVFTDVAVTKAFVRSLIGSDLIVKTPNGNVLLPLIEATVNFFDVLGMSFPGIQAWKASLGSQNPLPVALFHKTGAKTFAYTDIGQEFQTYDGDRIVVNGILPANFIPPTGFSPEYNFVPFEPKRGIITGDFPREFSPYFTVIVYRESF